MAGIEVIIGANTDDLDAAVRRSRSRLSELGGEMKGNIATAAKWGAAVSVAATAATAAMVASSLKSIDALAKTSDKLGIAISDLQALRQAAELTGVGTSTLDMSLQRMTRRLSEAAQGTGEAQDALKELNLDALALAKLSPDEQFREIAGAMEEVGAQSDRVRLAFKLFDSEGAALVNTLALGKQGLKDVGDEMDALGASIERVDAAKVEAANDAMLRVATAAGAVSDQLTIELASSITAVANQMVKEFSRGSGSLGTGMEDAVDVGVEALADFLDGAATVTDFISGNPIMAQFGILGWVVLGPKGLLIGAAIGATFDIIKEGLAEFGIGVSEGEANARKLLNVQKEIAEQQAAIGADNGIFLASSILEDRLKSLEKTEAELTTVVEGSSEAQAAYINLLTEGTDKADGFAGSLRRTADALREAREEAAKGIDEVLGVESSDGRGTNTPGENPRPTQDTEEESTTGFGVSEIEKRLEAIREAGLAEVDILKEKQALELEVIREGRILELEVKGGFDQLERETKQRHLDDMEAMTRKNAERLASIEKQKLEARQATTGQILGNMSSLMNTESRKMFEIGKTAAIANATISTLTGASKALELGWPLGPIAATAIAANGFAKVAAIKSQSFGGGGGSGGASNTASATAGGQGVGESTQRSTSIDISLIGGNARDSAVAGSVISQINDEIERGGRIARVGLA